MKEYDEKQKKLLCNIIDAVLLIVKWILLVVCVITTGLTLGLVIVYLVKGNDMANTIIASFINCISGYPTADTIVNITTVGKLKVVIAGFGYGLAYIIKTGLLYIVISKFREIFTTIKDGKMFTKSNVAILNEVIPYTLFIALTPAILLFIVQDSTGVFTNVNYDLSGIIYMFIAYIFKLIFEYGYEVQIKANKYDKESNDFKAKQEQFKIEALKAAADAKEKIENFKREAEKKVEETKVVVQEQVKNVQKNVNKQVNNAQKNVNRKVNNAQKNVNKQVNNAKKNVNKKINNAKKNVSKQLDNASKQLKNK